MTDLSSIRIETERLLLRVSRIEDFDRYAEMLADDSAVRFIAGTTLRAAAWRRFLQMPGAWHLQGFAMFSLIEKASGRWIGQAGPWRPEGWPGNEIGWSLHPEACGHGYATEAAAAAMDWAFERLGWAEVIHGIEPENIASQRVAQRLGSRIVGRSEGVPPFEGVVVDLWGQSRDAWLAQRAQVHAAVRASFTDASSTGALRA
jgi:RimJ/RimL family protein N-acetyltransferase